MAIYQDGATRSESDEISRHTDYPFEKLCLFTIVVECNYVTSMGHIGASIPHLDQHSFPVANWSVQIG